MTNTTKAKSDAPADLETIVDDMAALRREFAVLMSHLKSGATNGANRAAEATLAGIGDQANQLYDRVAAQGERSANAIGRQVEEQPVMSLLIAFGIGFLASRLLAR